MTFPSQFPDWLAQQARDGAGGPAAELPSIRLGTAYAPRFDLAAHPDLGDFTAGTFSMQAKASPTADTALATFACVTGTPSGGVTPVAVSLAVSAQSSLPDPIGTGVGEVFYDLLYTVSGSDPELIAAGRIPIVAGVTA
jgi:hypothetical protein